ncbi:MAG: nucleotidyl transferase AbiEii/AbiGii toxin family protein [Armatimonadetes bacterium]|nr:nucleotidyl transferase AbiEii/AbiGii toxin family protein [Armatimonadota bacterium]
MIRHEQIRDRVAEWGLREDVVEKDYVLGWLLWGIGTEPELRDAWVFKGGTCLKKCFLETYRFSEDLDFTVLPGGPVSPERVLPILAGLVERVAEASGIDLRASAPRLKKRPGGMSAEGRLYYRGPRNAPSPASVKIDLNGDEVLARSPVLRPISHPFPDALPDPGQVRCYAFEELFAEKLRALGERCRPRDLYDVIHLYWRTDLSLDPQTIHSVLMEKCATKGVPFPTLSLIENSPLRQELVSEWANMLGHQLRVLPPIEPFLEELAGALAWLNGSSSLHPLPGIAGAEDDLARGASPLPGHSEFGTPLLPIRFAAANRLCIELRHEGSIEVVEPYALRRSREDRHLLYALECSTRKIRSYRVDRIRSIRVTTQPFRPLYAVECAAAE